MSVKKILIVVSGLILLSVSGCAMQADMIDMENEVRIMKGMLLETQRDVSHLQKTEQAQHKERPSDVEKEKAVKAGEETKEAIETLQKNQAGFEIRFDQLSTDVQVMQGSLELNSHKVMEFSEDMENQNAAVEELVRKLDTIETKLKEVSEADAKPLSDKMVNTNTTAPSISPSEIYNQAYKDYVAGHYDLAVIGFNNYLNQAQDGNLAPNAMYWMGESYYSKGEYENAVNKFKKVADQYPKSDKLAGALLKIGYAYERMGDKDKASVYLKKVIEQFPNTQEASLSKVKLGEIQ